MLDENSPLSLYYQLKKIIIDNIKDKVWALDSKIPTERELCDIYKVSRITVRQALKELEQEGYLYRKQGRGTFVKGQTFVQKLSTFYSFTEEIKKMGSVPTTRILSYKTIPSSKKIASKLSVEQGAEVIGIKRLRLADNEPFAVETSYLVRKYTENLKKEDVELLGLYKALSQDCSIEMSDAIETFEAMNVSEIDSEVLGVPKREAILHLDRIAYSKGIIIEYCSSIIRGDRYKYTVQLTKS